MFKVDYNYYKNEYGPHSISACSLIDMYTFNRISSDSVIDEAKNAVCELVDFINSRTDEKIISSEKIGQGSVTYDTKYEKSLDNSAYDIVRKHLIHTGLMYRGK